MVWQVNWEVRASRELLKLDKPTQREILRYLDERVAAKKDPRTFGSALTGDLSGLWRYRVQDYRIVCRITDEKLIVLVIHVGHRRQIYKNLK